VVSLSRADTRYSVHNFVNNLSVIKYITGFVDFTHLLLLFYILGPAVNHLNYKCSVLEFVDQLFSTVIKLRQAKDDFELALLFKLSQTTVAAIIGTWIKVDIMQLYKCIHRSSSTEI